MRFWILNGLWKRRVFLIRDNTDLFIYIKQIFDCDDFADILYVACKLYFGGSNNFGKIWSYTHAQNIFYDLDKEKFYMIEPQNDIKKILKIKRKYMIRW